MKKETGITLVALIITIIVMLILVGVSIRVVVNSGILGIAKNAGDSTKTAYNEESNFGGVITIGGKQYASIEDYRAGNEIVGNTTGGGENPEVPPVVLPEVLAGTRATSKSTYTSGGKTAIIPAGFTVSKLNDENTIAGGLVIYLIPNTVTNVQIEQTSFWTTDTDSDGCANVKENYDQFVWIPIDDIEEMFICQGRTAEHNEECNISLDGAGNPICTTASHATREGFTNPNTLMAGRLYATELEETFDANLENQIYTINSGLREPDTVNHATNADGNTELLNQIPTILGAETTGYGDYGEFKDTLQEEYNEIVKSIYENKGFWVGRYETSGMDNANHTVNIVAGTSTGINSTTWYRMYAKQKIYTSKKSLTGVGSGMILGAMHDQVLKFVDTPTYDVTTSGYVQHGLRGYNAGPYQTGGVNYATYLNNDENYLRDYPYNDYSKNIYDLEGNVEEWTTEADDSYSRVFRGR